MSQIVASSPDASWLPRGGWADVVLAPDGPLPAPLGLVRLLVTDAAGRVFCVGRSGGRPGWDLPTATVPDGDPAAAVGHLTQANLGRVAKTALLGFVRNVVPDGTLYEWPSPVAHFAVVRPVAPGLAPVVDGVWLGREEAARELGERHWWPLVAVDPDLAAPVRDELVVAGGYWLDRDPPDRDRVIHAAVDALVEGLDSPALRALAGLVPEADPAEIDTLVLEVADELGLPVPGRSSALRTEAVGLARAVVDGRAQPRRLTVWAYQRVGYDGDQGLLALVRLDDEYGLLEEVDGLYEVPDRQERLRALDDVVRAAAAALVAGETHLSSFLPARWRA